MNASAEGEAGCIVRAPLSLMIWAAAPLLWLLKQSLVGDQAFEVGGSGCTTLTDPGAYALDVLPVQVLAVTVVMAAAIQVGKSVLEASDSLRTTVGVLAWGLAAAAGTLLVAAAPRLDGLSLLVIGVVAMAVIVLSIGGLAVAGWWHWQPPRRRFIGLHILTWLIGTIGMVVAIGGNGEVPVC